MNPVLLKPTGDVDAQVIVEGRPLGSMSAAAYHHYKPQLLEPVLESLRRLRCEFDAVVLEGAGSPAEINLADSDIVNLRIAERAGVPAIVVGDIDLGGVFASLAGTVSLLPSEQRRLVRGFVINKFRGDSGLLGDGLVDLERHSGVPTLGVIPMLEELHIDAEDSVALAEMPPPRADAHLDVAVIAFPYLSNFTDLDPLLGESDIAVRLVRSARELGRPDLIVLGGSKAMVKDLAWMRSRGIADALLEAVNGHGAVVLGVCGGYQMLGTSIDDDIESRQGKVQGLGLLSVETMFSEDKVLAQRRGEACGADLWGYQIHHGRVQPASHSGEESWLWLDGEPEGWCSGRVMGTSLHGVFESDDFRHAFLAQVAAERGCPYTPEPGSFADRREAQFDKVADAIEEHVDVRALLEIMGIAA